MELDNSEYPSPRCALARRQNQLGNAFEAAPLIKPPALRGVSDLAHGVRRCEKIGRHLSCGCAA
jgi:hypothetical protein